MDVHKKWVLEKYAKWDSNIWNQITPSAEKPLTLIIQEVQLLVIHGVTAIESFSLAPGSQRVRAVYKDRTLAFGIKHEAKSAKFRVLFNTPFEAASCVGILEKYISISGLGDKKDKAEKPKDCVTLPGILAEIMKGDRSRLPAPDSIPADYPLESGIRLCILDPGFPELVGQVEDIMNKIGCKL